MLKAHSEIMTSRGLRLERATHLEEVLSIKLSLKHSLSIFEIAHLKSPYGAVNDLSDPVYITSKPGWHSKMTYPARYR